MSRENTDNQTFGNASAYFIPDGKKPANAASGSSRNPQNSYTPYNPQGHTVRAERPKMTAERASISIREYRQKHLPSKYVQDIKSLAIAAYICAGITTILAIFLNPFSLIDAALLGGFALGMHIKHSKGCAIALLILSVVEFGLALAQGLSAGYLWIIFGILAVITFWKIDKEYPAFLETYSNQNASL